MQSTSNDSDTEAALRTLRFVVGAMMAGVLVFALTAIGFAGVLAPDPEPRLARILLSALVLLGLGEAMVYPLVRRAAVRLPRSGATPPGAELLLTRFRSLTIVAAAMAEGFALFGIVIYLVTRAPLGLAAAVLGLLVLLRLLPVESRLTRFAAEARGSLG